MSGAMKGGRNRNIFYFIVLAGLLAIIWASYRSFNNIAAPTDKSTYDLIQAADQHKIAKAVIKGNGTEVDWTDTSGQQFKTIFRDTFPIEQVLRDDKTFDFGSLQPGKTVEAVFLAHGAVTREVSLRIGLDPGVGEALSHAFARWDGKGVPRGIASEEVPMSVRLMQLAEGAEVHHRLHGVEGATEMARLRAGKLFSPELVQVFCEGAPEILGDQDETTWDRVIDAEPLPRPPLTEEGFDSALEVLADIADLKSPWFSGHSRGVADLAAHAVRAAGMPERDVVTLRRAGLLHDIGRTAIANSIWDKKEPLTEGERERVRLHAYYTARLPPLPPLSRW